uniref:Coiled-coil domain-containing protein 12 n=1 Tax=Steinernema glaseri TaxID=37863 RepID=A0A1I7Y157_9BILA
MGSSDEEEVCLVSEAEKIAAERKKRLMAMKSKVHGLEMREEDYVEEMEQDEPKANANRLPSFRSYEPEVFIEAGKNENRNLNLVDEHLTEQLADTNDTSVIQEISVNTLAPRKLDWDLKRDVKEKLEKLERQTQRAINQLIRQRLATGENDLATAVNSAMKAGLQEED